MKPNGKCIAKKCEDCNFYRDWDMTNKDGLRKVMKQCGFAVLFDEIPHIKGSIDGVQRASNETRNRVQCLGDAMVNSKLINATKLIGEK